MPLGIRPTNDFAFKKTFGSPGNKLALISLLNAILELNQPIVDVTIENPFNWQDFHDDKLSILDVRAVDDGGAIYDVEMQLSNFSGLVQRIVFYGCEIYAGQLRAGEDYLNLKPVFSICLLEGVLWRDSRQVHHAFRLTDQASGRVLDRTLEIHTLELGRYNLQEHDLPRARLLDLWLYWFLHAHEYEAADLLRLFPQEPIQQATRTLHSIAAITEDKSMYDAREKSLRDQQWALHASRMEGEAVGRREGELKGRQEGELKGRQEGEVIGRREGEILGKTELIRTLCEILGEPPPGEEDLSTKSLDELHSIASHLQAKLRNRHASP